jgi:hypothetical protein
MHSGKGTEAGAEGKTLLDLVAQEDRMINPIT